MKKSTNTQKASVATAFPHGAKWVRVDFHLHTRENHKFRHNFIFATATALTRWVTRSRRLPAATTTSVRKGSMLTIQTTVIDSF